MLNRLILSSALAVVAVLGVTLESQAGLFRRSSGGCDTGCNTGCATVAAPVQYEERKVTAYKFVTVEKEIEAIVCRKVVTNEKYVYTVCVPVTKQETRKETFCTTVQREVEYKYTVMVPRTVTEVVKCTSYTCVRENIVEQVPVCKIVRVNYVDECGRCCTKCERVTVMEERTRCITKRIPVVTDVTVNRIVCDAVVKVGKKIVCDLVPQTRDVVVNVCSFEHQKREGVRQVCSFVNEKIKQKVQVCERVAYETTVRVAVCNTGCNTGCDTGCATSGHGGGHHGGLFRRGGGCCGN